MDRNERKASYQEAKKILNDDFASASTIASAIEALPTNGNKALALRVRLNRKLDGLEDNWEI